MPATYAEAHPRVQVRNISGFAWMSVVGLGAILASALYLLVAGAVLNREAPLVTGIIMTSFAVPMFAFGLTSFRPFVVTSQEVRIPRVIRTDVIPIETVAGVGLLYRFLPNSGSPPGWTLVIWRTDGSRCPVGKIRQLTPSNLQPRPPPLQESFFGPYAQPDWALGPEAAAILADSRVGRIAREVYDIVLDVQGSTGPLARQALQKAERYNVWDTTKTLAWWSPDGSIGQIGPHRRSGPEATPPSEAGTENR